MVKDREVIHINGQPPRKSNNRRIILINKKPRLIKSAAAIQWVKDAILQIPQSSRKKLGRPGHPVSISCMITYRNRLPDLSVELLLDVLQKAGVISDDRYVFHIQAWKLIGKPDGVTAIVREIDSEMEIEDDANSWYHSNWWDNFC